MSYDIVDRRKKRIALLKLPTSTFNGNFEQLENKYNKVFGDDTLVFLADFEIAYFAKMIAHKYSIKNNLQKFVNSTSSGREPKQVANS